MNEKKISWRPFYAMRLKWTWVYIDLISYCIIFNSFFVITYLITGCKRYCKCSKCKRIWICLSIVNLIKFFIQAVQRLKSETKHIAGCTHIALVWPGVIGVRLTMQQLYKSSRLSPGNQGHININETKFCIYC